MALKAQLLLKTGRVDEALVTARAAVAADLTFAKSRFVLGEALSKAGDLNGAFTEYLEAFRLGPKLTHLVPTLARLGLETGRNRDALVYAQQATALFPADVDAAVAYPFDKHRREDDGRVSTDRAIVGETGGARGYAAAD